jgi:peptide/nickel transport system substrate-binding protein
MRVRTGSKRARTLAAGIAGLTLCLVAGGCTSSSSPAATTKSGSPRTVEGGVLRLGTTAPIDSLNPFVSQSDYSYVAYEYMYPQLTQYDGKLAIKPDFATSWTTSPDGLVWTFTTRTAATWSDGTPLTAADPAWTINLIKKYQDGATANSAGLVAHLVSAVATTPTTLVLTYDKPVANVLAQMQQMSILPKQVWGQYATGDGSKLKTFQNPAPIVSGGPFMLTKYTKDQIALFARNPKWYGTKPHLDGFGLQFFANDDAMVTALKTGQIDMTGEYTPPTAVDALKKAGLEVDTVPSISMKTFIINTNPKKTKNRELLDPNVRQAMEYAVDRASIIKTAWLGFAQPGTTIIAPSDGDWNDKSIPGLPFDLAKANALLDAAGFPKGSGGIRQANGHAMSYDVIFPQDEKGAGDRTFQILQTDFAQIGIQLKQKPLDDDAAVAAINDADNTYRTYDLAMYDWVPPVDPDFMLSVMTCAQLGNNSDSGYCDPSYDAMYAQQSVLTDSAARHALVNQMQQKIYNDRPYVILDYPDIIEAHAKGFVGFEMSPVMGSVNSLSMDTLLGLQKTS